MPPILVVTGGTIDMGLIIIRRGKDADNTIVTCGTIDNGLIIVRRGEEGMLPILVVTGGTI